MNTQYEESDFSEYKLVRINKKTNGYFKKKNNKNKPKENKPFNKNSDTHYINKESRNSENYQAFQNNYKKYENKNYKCNQFSYQNSKFSQKQNKFNDLKEVQFQHHQKIELPNENYKNMVIQTINESINVNNDCKNKLSFRKVHDWDFSKREAKENKQDIIEGQMYANTEYRNSLPFKSLPIFPNQFIFFMPPPIMFNNPQFMFEMYNPIKNIKRVKNPKFLNYDNNFLQDLSKSLTSECKLLQDCGIKKAKSSESIKSEETLVEIQKNNEFDSNNDNLSSSTIEESTPKNRKEKSINVTIRIAKEKKILNLLIDETSDILNIARNICKENKLKEMFIFSIYKKIKSAFEVLVDIKGKNLNTNIKNLSNRSGNDDRYFFI